MLIETPPSIEKACTKCSARCGNDAGKPYNIGRDTAGAQETGLHNTHFVSIHCHQKVMC